MKVEALRKEVRPATQDEIGEFWNRVEKFLDDKTIVEYLIDYVDKHLPLEHQINARVAQSLQQVQKAVLLLSGYETAFRVPSMVKRHHKILSASKAYWLSLPIMIHIKQMRNDVHI